MTDDDVFQVQQVIAMIENQLVSNPNSCELEYYIKLKKELEDKLKEYYENYN